MLEVILLHMSLAGMQYHESCCSGKDCFEVPCEMISPVNGGYRIEYTGETFKGTVHPSTDGKCHLCTFTATPFGKPICVYIVPSF